MRSATIDIGYNAIRATVYEDNTLGAPEIFSSKFKSDLIGLLANQSIDMKHQTYLSIQYLLHVFKRLNVTDIKCVATAVLRDHEKAEQFIQHIRDKYNFDIEVISGEKEANLTAFGLVKGIRNCKGIAADLGGGSLELAEVGDGKISKLCSLALGTKILSMRNLADENEIIDIIKEQYSSSEQESLYLIGGSLRFIGKSYMNSAFHYVKNLHNFEIEAGSFFEYLNAVQTSDGEISKLSSRRINNNAVLILKALIHLFNPKKIIVSTYGLKEGVRIDSMDEEEKQKDLILEKVKYLCTYDTDATDFDSYYKIISPLFSAGVDLNEILKLAIMLLSMESQFDSTLPPTALSDSILSSEIPFAYKMRVMLAMIIAYSTNHKPSVNLIKFSKKTLTQEEHNNAQIIGYFLYITKEIDGPIFMTPSFDIKSCNYFLEIDTHEILPRAIFEKVCMKLKSIAFARRTGY